MAKTRKFRGSRTYGRGRGRSHNYGSGNRGGRGSGGSGKKGDAKKPSFWKNPFKKVAFGMNHKAKHPAINVGQVEVRVETLISQGKLKKGSKISLDLNKLGYKKLLGSGKIKSPVNITVDFASKKAIDKVKEAGGEIILKQNKE